MAEVTGDFGGQPIELNNAATEATLKQLLAAMTVIANNTGKDKAAQNKSAKELEAELKKLAKQAKEQGKLNEIAAKQAKDKAKLEDDELKRKKKQKEAEEQYLNSLKRIEGMFDRLGNATTSLALGMTGLIKDLSDVGNSLTSAAAALNNIPVVGNLLAGVFGAVASAAEKSTKSFQSAATAGATFSGSVNEFKNAANSAGMTMEDFGRIISQNGDSLRLLGGTTEAGAKRFADLSRNVRTTSRDLYALGYSTEDVNQGLANYTKYLGQTGKLGKMNDAELISGTKNYLKEMDALAKITGETRKEQEDARAKLLADAQYQGKIANMGADAGEALANTINGLPAGLRDTAKDIMVTGTATTEESRKFMALMPKSAALMQKYAQITEAGGTLTKQQQDDLRNTLAEEGAARKQQYRSVGMYNKDLAGTYMQVTAASNITKDAAKKAAEEQAKAAEQTDGLNQKVEQSKAALAAFSNNFTMALANSGMLDQLMSIFGKLAEFTSTVVLPVFSFMADNIGLVAGVLVAFKAVVLAAQLAQALQTLGITATLAPLAGMAGAMWAVISPLLAAAAPFIAVAAAVGGVVYLFKKLYDNGWTFGTAIEAVKDNLKLFWLTLVDAVNGLLSIIPNALGGISKDEAKRRKEATDAERKDLSEKAKLRDEERKKVREDRGTQEEYAKKEEEASKKVTDAKEKEAAASGATQTTPSTPGLDVSSPEALYKSAMARKNATRSAAAGAGPGAAPGAAGTVPMPTMEGLGKVAAHFESGGNAGTISSGHGDFGGKSYGAFQLSSKTGDVQKFLEKSGYAKQFQGMSVGSAEFDKKWKELAQDKGFGEAQRQHAVSTHYLPQVQKLQKAGIDLSGKGAGVQEAIMSTANQYGANTDVIQKALGGKDISKMSDKDIINSIQDFKAQSISSRFKSSSASVQAGVAKRVEQERAMLLGTQGASPVLAGVSPVTPSQTQVAAATTPAAGATAATAADQAKEAAKQTTQARGYQTPTPKPAQESVETLLAQLNMKMDQLIRISSRGVDVNSRQLSAQKEATGNLYAV